MPSKLKLFSFGLLFLFFILSCIVIRNAYVPLSELRTNFNSFEYHHDDNSVQRFIGGLRFPTISWSPGKQNYDALLQLKDFIYRSYPLIHSSKRVQHEVVNQYSLLYIIKGLNASLKPAVLLAHLDVVPTKEQNWDTDPFSPTIKDGYIYARGTLDDKGCVFASLEAIESLLAEDHQFERDVILGLGHDEEVSGYHGAGTVSKRLYELGYRQFEFIMDEGLTIIKDVFPMVDDTFALIGTDQKGFVDVNLTVERPGGHSSMPAPESAIGILAAAVSRIESNPFPSMLNRGPETEMLNRLGRVMPFFKRIILSNSWLFKPIIDRILSRKNWGNAILRTTTAVTQFHAGFKNNILATTAWAMVNVRIHPRQTVPEVLTHLRNIIADDRVKMEASSIRHPLGPAGTYGTFGFDLIGATIRQMYPSVKISPGLMMAMTDSPHFKNFTKNIYLFNPTSMNGKDVPGIHGKNERISVESYRRLIEFYYRMLKNMKTFTVERQSHAHDSEL